MKSILYNYTPQELQQLLDTSNSYSDVLLKIGLYSKDANPETLKRVIKEYNLNEEKLNYNRRKLFASCAKKTHAKKDITLNDIFDNKARMQSSKLLSMLVRQNYKKYECECCGISSWNNKPITLQLHHKDGNHFNNNLDNLVILCPNCHTQTNNYCGKNSKKQNKKYKTQDEIEAAKSRSTHKGQRRKDLPISREDLKYKIRYLPFVKIAEEYGVSDSATKKWCDRYNLPRKKSIINKINKKDWSNI